MDAASVQTVSQPASKLPPVRESVREGSALLSAEREETLQNDIGPHTFNRVLSAVTVADQIRARLPKVWSYSNLRQATDLIESQRAESSQS